MQETLTCVTRSTSMRGTGEYQSPFTEELMSANLITYIWSNRFVQISEIDEYREKYHLFDKALFLMPPKHWLRSFCNTILSAQLADPQSNPSFRPRPDQLRAIVKNRVRYLFR